MRYYIIAGEASGDLHSSNLVKNIKISDPQAEFRGWGGDLMQQQGVTLVKHYRDLAFMGFAEVVQHLPTILKNIDFCKKDILEYKPDVLILVDYPGFNLRIAKFAKQAGLKVVFYISPQVWAWKSSRVKLIKEVVDKMLVIFPFETEFYQKHNYKVDFVGHPLLDAINGKSYDRATFLKENNLPDKPIVALLPGSRKQEIGNMLSVMTEVAVNFPDHQFVIGGAPSSNPDWYKDFLDKKNISIVYGKTYPLLSNAVAALVTSGTATLETALWGVPEAICYRSKGITGNISYLLAKQLIGKKLKYIGIVNLIMDKEIVKEFIQHNLTVSNLTTELKKILEDKAYRNQMMENIKQVKEKLGGPGASAKAASIITEFAKQSKSKGVRRGWAYMVLALMALLPVLASSVNISVHIYSTQPVSSVIVAPALGKYILIADGKTIDSCNNQSVYEISLENDSVLLKSLGKKIGTYLSVRLHGIGSRNELNIRPLTAAKTRLYDDDLVASSNTTELKLICICELEHYIAGVIECEAGRRKPPEYDKVQAIICRTFALANLAKHISDGFELCDGVHCQVYQGTATTNAVIDAVNATKGIVLVDENNLLIDAAFHSNCGGYTMNSEDVWNKALPYLRAIPDTFCLHQPAANWEKQISAKSWRDYLDKKEKGLQPDTLRTEAYWDSIPVNRRIYFYDNGYEIPLKEMRLDLNLHSTCFTAEKDGDLVVLHGHGYGHRVGLCQEGAIHMSQLGYNYRQILHYYYTDVQLIDYTILPSSGYN